MKRDFCRTPSIGFNGHRYSNLFDGGSSSSNPSLPSLRSPFCSTLILSLSLSLSLALILFDLRVLPMTKTVTRNRCELPCGVGSESGEKEFASRFSLFFRLPFDHRYSRADLERKPHRQMRASTRGNCTSLSLSSSLSSIFRAVFPSLGSLDLKERLVSRYNVLRGE